MAQPIPNLLTCQALAESLAGKERGHVLACLVAPGGQPGKQDAFPVKPKSRKGVRK
jgi:hypothetical protein